MLKEKFQKLIYKMKGHLTNIQELPPHIFVEIMRFFDIKERYKL